MAELADALAELARSETLLVALDFDGTLAPLVDDPDEARALPRAREALLTLLELARTPVALISGRAMDSLVAVSDLPDTALLSGSHGIELKTGGDPSVTLTADEIDRLSRLRAALESVASAYDQVWIEVKPAGFALHSRLASDTDADAATRDAVVAVAAIDGLTARRGSDVIEFSVRSTNKGDAIQRLREHSGATAVFFAGDDVTDEDGFAALKTGDLGLKCGTGTTLAAFSVAGPAEVAEVLHELAELRTRAISR